MRGEAEELENDPCLREQRKNRKFKNRLGLKCNGQKQARAPVGSPKATRNSPTNHSGRL